LKYSLLLTIPSAFGISVLGENILQTMTKSEFVQGAVIIPILSIGMISYGIYYLFSSVLLLVKKTIYITHAISIAAISNIVLNIILIPLYGIWGAAMASMVAYLLMMFFGFHISRRYITFDLNARFILKSVIAASIMSLVIMQLHPVGILQLIITVCIGAGVYGLTIILIGGITRSELVFFWNLGCGLAGIRRNP
jgi:O-antigen/teichoic acid export membrane protein